MGILINEKKETQKLLKKCISFFAVKYNVPDTDVLLYILPAETNLGFSFRGFFYRNGELNACYNPLNNANQWEIYQLLGFNCPEGCTVKVSVLGIPSMIGFAQFWNETVPVMVNLFQRLSEKHGIEYYDLSVCVCMKDDENDLEFYACKGVKSLKDGFFDVNYVFEKQDINEE